MREKVIDVVLIVTLIVVAFGITWTLLTLNRDDSRPVRREAAGEQVQNDRGNEGSTRIAPLPIEPTPRQGTTTRENGAEDSARAQIEGRPVAPPDTARAEPVDPDPVPPGAVRIERVGFSFVTGGAGACGIVLEPWTHVAVSRELLAAYGCGAEISLSLDDEKGGREQVRAIVADTMNPSFSRTVNIYVGEDEPALDYGVTAGTLRPLEENTP